MAELPNQQDIKRLNDDVVRFTDVIKKLTAEGKARPRGTEKMPTSELLHCHGVAFTTVVKAGVGVGVGKGHGFVIAKLPNDVIDEPAKWSAPLFLTVGAGSIGATLGWSSIDSVVILDTPEAVQSFRNRVFELDADVTGAAGPAAAAHQPATAVNLSNTSLTSHEFAYSIASGVMLDVSWSGVMYSLDSGRNRAFYGNVSPSTIMHGGVSAPDGMQELYDALNQAIKEYLASGKAEAEVMDVGDLPRA